MPPPDDPAAKGKSPTPPLTAVDLRRQKVRLLKLCVCYAYAVKHYLRGEDGLEWEDYAGILPATVAGLAQPSGSRKTSAWTSYAATASASRSDSGSESRDEEDGQEAVRKTDATKRIRVKRSKDKLKQPGVRGPSHKTPLLDALHHTIDFNADPDSLSTPLPLVYVYVRLVDL